MPREPISIVLAADETYAMPLAVTVKSVLLSLSQLQQLHVYVMDFGLTELSRQRILSSLNDNRLSITWLSPELEVIASLPVDDNLSCAAYARLLIVDLLPASVERVIYLDSDLLVLHDLIELWQIPFDTAACLAVQDIAAPWFDSEVVLSNYDKCSSYLAAVRPIANYRELGLSASTPYLNSGVLVINVRKWREMNVAQLAFDCLNACRNHAFWYDQYALNVVLHNLWGQLDLRWNQGSQIYVYPSWQDSPLNQSSFRQLRSAPFIVHFTTKNKPWHLENRHPWRGRYFKTLDKTAWAGWRPGTRYQRIAFMLKQCMTLFRRETA